MEFQSKTFSICKSWWFCTNKRDRKSWTIHKSSDCRMEIINYYMCCTFEWRRCLRR